MNAKAFPRTPYGPCRSVIALVTVLLAAGGCYDSLDKTSVACRPGKERNCPGGLVCRVAPGSEFGRCCNPGDLACGAVDASGDVASTTNPDASEASSAHDGSGGWEAGADAIIVKPEVGGWDGAMDANPQIGADADRDVPQIGTDAAGGSGGNTGGSPGTGGSTATGGVTGGQGGGAGTKTGGNSGATGGVAGTGGTGTGGTSVAGTGGTGTGGGVGTGGVVGTGGSGTGGTPIVGTGGATVAPSTLVTSGVGAYWQAGTWTEVTGAADVTVNDTTTYQTWEGFGGTFHEKGWSYLSSTALQNQAMSLLFGSNGARFAWGRIPMGANDYAIDRYTDDETAGDTTMANFSITRDLQKLIPYIKAAQTIKPDLRFWASPWTPPTWMKTVATFDGANMTSDDTTLKAYAQYFIKFIQAYQSQGITIEAVAPQNEPGYAQAYPSCLWDAATYTSFVGGYLGPAFATAGLSTKIMLGTFSNGDTTAKDPAIVSAVMTSATAKPFISIVGVEWSMMDRLSTYKSSLGSLPVWLTTHKCGNYPWGSSYVGTAAPNDQAYGVESWGLIRDAIKAGVTVYNVPHMVLDPVGKGIDTTRDWAQNALLVVNAGALVQTPAYYVFRHLSQFVVPGAKVVGTSGNADALAFKNPDGSIVTVVFNAGTSAKTMILSVGAAKLQFSVPANGWATVRR